MLRKVLVVAAREYQAAVRTRTFLITVVLMPVMMSGGLIVQKIMKSHTDTSDKRFAIIDRTGKLFDAIRAAAEERNATAIFETPEGDAPGKHDQPASAPVGEKRQIEPRFLVETVEIAGKDPVQVRLEQSDRVQSREIYGFLEIAEDAFTADHFREEGQAGHYYSDNVVNDDFRKWVSGPVSEAIQTWRLGERGIKPDDVRWVTQSVWFPDHSLVKMVQGKIEEGGEDEASAGVIVGVAMVMLMFMVVTIGATPLISVVLEEKANRIAEVLLGSIAPFDLMLGKLVGSVGVALTVVGVYMLGGYGVARYLGYAQYMPDSTLLVWFVVFQAFAILLFGSMFVAVGAACNDMKDAQSALLPIWLLLCIPMFVIGPVIKEPSNSFATALSLFPPATPMLMPMRMAMLPQLPLWQPLAGLAGCLLASLFCVFAAGRIFRIGLLMQGKTPKATEILRWLVSS